MGPSEYWHALTSQQRVGLSVGAALIVAVAIGCSIWLLRDPYVPLASAMSAERLNEIAKQLDVAKVDFRVEGDSVAVPRSLLGKARAVAAGDPFGAPPSVGLELFKETDFSSTDFAQRINYQRALQGELTRTIQTIAGVRNARVHVILPDSGLFKRNAAKATAAVSVALQPGNALARSQVRGIQRLVAASVPEIKVDDVVVLDESGVSLTRPAAEGEGDLSSAQLELKRQADQYLEGKVLRLLQDLVPNGTAALSVDTTLDEKQLRVTTDEPLAARTTHTARESEHAAGVLVKERQSQHGRISGMMQTGSDVPDADSTDWEYEYKVGNRVEQMLSAPGSIKRVSVAVALRGAPTELTGESIEDLVAHAVGLDHARGDSVMVMLLPAVPSRDARPLAASAAPMLPRVADDRLTPVSPSENSLPLRIWIAAALFAAALIIFSVRVWLTAQADKRSRSAAATDVDAVAAKVRQWLNEGADRGRS